MKKVVYSIITIVSLIFLLSACQLGKLEEGTVRIDETTFPDEKFREYILNLPWAEDKKLTNGEISNVINIDVSKMEIGDLTGIEYFTNLETLNCEQNNLTQLDLRNNSKLKELDCYFNKKLIKLNVENNNDLVDLNCSACNLDSINIKNNLKLQVLKCNGNNLTELDVRNNLELETLCCYINKISSLDVSNNKKLKQLYCYDNNIAVLDVSNNLELAELGCEHNNLSELDVSKNLKLEKLNYGNNNFDYVDISNNYKLNDYSDGYNSVPKANTSKDDTKYDLSVKTGMTRSQIETIWGSPFMKKVEGEETVCYYYDKNGNIRVVYYSNNVCGAIMPDYYALKGN